MVLKNQCMQAAVAAGHAAWPSSSAVAKTDPNCENLVELAQSVTGWFLKLQTNQMEDATFSVPAQCTRVYCAAFNASLESADCDWDLDYQQFGTTEADLTV